MHKVYHCKIPYQSTYPTNVTAILKLTQAKQANAILHIFKPYIRNKKSTTDLKNILEHNEKIHKYISIFLSHTQTRWNSLTRRDYVLGTHLPAQFMTNDQPNPAFLEKTLTNLIKIGSLRNLSFLPFILSQDFYAAIGAAPKKIVGKSYLYDRINNSFVMRNLLTCTINNQTYLLYSDTTAYENYPGMSISLNLLVNGYSKGIKPLFRFDTNGHLSKEVCDKYDIPYSINQRSNAILNNEFYHMENSRKQKGEPISMNEHMHKASYADDVINACVYYLRHSLCLRGEVKTSNMPAENTNLYATLYPHEKVRNIAQIKDSFALNGYIPFARIEAYANKMFHIENNEKSDAFYEVVDQCRSNLYDHNFQKINSYLPQENIPVISVFRPDPAPIKTQDFGFELKK